MYYHGPRGLRRHPGMNGKGERALYQLADLTPIQTGKTAAIQGREPPEVLSGES